MRERGREVEAILLQYERFVRPAFEAYIYPTKDFADIIVPRGSANEVALNVLVEHLRDKRTRSASIISKDTSLVEEIQNKK
jgi:uridine kinase